MAAACHRGLHRCMAHHETEELPQAHGQGIGAGADRLIPRMGKRAGEAIYMASPGGGAAGELLAARGKVIWAAGEKLTCLADHP